MSRASRLLIVRTWTGIGALGVALAASVWLLSVYVHAVRVTPADTARVEDLKEKAKADPEIQKVLQPELDRQHEVLARRWSAYDRGGALLLVSAGIFLVWIKWFRPRTGEWAGLPAGLLEYLNRPEGDAMRGTVRNKEGASATRSMAPLLSLPPAGSKPASVDVSHVDEILEKEGRTPDAIIPILQSIQSRYRYLPEEALRRIVETSEITPAQIAGIASFYGQFRLEPVGEHVVRVCEGTACHVAGAMEVDNELRRCLGMKNGSSTDPSGRFTIEKVACIGSCSLAPVITIDEEIYGKLSALTAGQALHSFLDAESSKAGDGNGRPGQAKPLRSGVRPPARGKAAEIRIGLGSCGIASGAREVLNAVEAATAEAGGGAEVKSVGCLGVCHHEPLIEVVEGGKSTLYGNVSPADVRKIVRRHVKPNGVVRRLREEVHDARARLFRDDAWNPIEDRRVDAGPYMKPQVRVVLENCGEIDPLSMDDYLGRDGFRALRNLLNRHSPEEAVGIVRASGLRGRGGAGFPTGVKWDLTRRAPGTVKYVICNGDEGDPGAFMDRAVLEADPFRVIEGLIIAGYAIGAGEGFVYVRREYPIAARHVRNAIRRAEEAGFLGESVCGTSFSFRIRVREGAGAFVCGEETALIQSIEGKRGMPRLRPPYPAQSGLWGKPTLINNVETLACLPWIFRHGAGAFASLGTGSSKGTKVFSLVGKVNRGGLIEVPMGITIREIVEGIGGGIRGGGKFKAVLAGGPSGGCIPESLADTRIDYEELASTGSIMGSGGLVVLDDHDCAVEIARYFLNFTQNESCGKCTFCRIGTKRMLEILERICAGRGREGDLETLEELSLQVKQASLCGLGQTAPNPVLTTLRYFREEYEAHIREKRCPARHCKALIHYRVLERCTGCTLCAQACPAGAIEARPYLRHEVKGDLCTRCGMCLTACPENAVEIHSPGVIAVEDAAFEMKSC